MKVLVVGDSCVDHFVYCHVDRLCPEAPVPVLRPYQTTSNSGMAGNVARNLTSLGADVDLTTNSVNIRKTRYVDNKSGQMIMRLDEEDSCEQIQWTQVNIDYSLYDAVVISDYDKGFLSVDDINWIADSKKCPVFLDTKKAISLNKFSPNIDYFKINMDEWMSLPDDDDTRDNYFKCIVTRGPEGAIYAGNEYTISQPVQVSDVSGAGDTFLAAVVYSYIKDGSIDQAIHFANDCASQVVQQRGVTTL